MLIWRSSRKRRGERSPVGIFFETATGWGRAIAGWRTDTGRQDCTTLSGPVYPPSLTWVRVFQSLHKALTWTPLVSFCCSDCCDSDSDWQLVGVLDMFRRLVFAGSKTDYRQFISVFVIQTGTHRRRRRRARTHRRSTGSVVLCKNTTRQVSHCSTL